VQIERLTLRELLVLELMARGQRNRIIAEALSVTEGTVKVHTKSTSAKLGVATRGEAFVIAAERALVRLQPDGKTKIPYFITLNDQEMFALAGLWNLSRTNAGELVHSCVHITMPANNLVDEIHNTKHRMPAILAREDHEAWMSGSPDEAWAALKPHPDEHMLAWPVSKNVNSPGSSPPSPLHQYSCVLSGCGSALGCSTVD
jgi:DNA-binding CsgD family transcriptional regulator